MFFKTRHQAKIALHIIQRPKGGPHPIFHPDFQIQELILNIYFTIFTPNLEKIPNQQKIHGEKGKGCPQNNMSTQLNFAEKKQEKSTK